MAGSPGQDYRSPDTREAAESPLKGTVPVRNPKTGVLELPPLKKKKKKQPRRVRVPVAYTTSHPELSGEARIDPGAGIVAYGATTKKAWEKKARERARRQRLIDKLLAEQPRLAPTSRAQAAHAKKYGWDPTDEAILRSTGMDPLFKASARATGLSPTAKFLMGHAVSQPGFDPKNPWEWVDAALLPTLIFPAFRPIGAVRGAVKGGAALTKGVGKDVAAQVAREGYHAPGIVSRGFGEARRTIPAWREAYVNGAKFREPAAESALGRAVEAGIDSLRSRTGWTKRKAGQYARKAQAVDTQTESIALTRLRRYARKVKNPVEWKALQLVAENVSPYEAVTRDLANAARSSDKLVQYNLHTHARLSAEASKYIVWDPVAQKNVWTNQAPRYLRDVDAAMRKGSEYREGVLDFYQVLNEETMAGRVDKPAQLTDEWIGLDELEKNAGEQRGALLDTIFRVSLNDPTLEHLTGDALDDAARERALANIGRLDAMAISWASHHNLRARSARAVFADRLKQEGRELPPEGELPEWMRDVAPSDFYKGLRAVLDGFPDEEIVAELEKFPNHLMQSIDDWAFSPKLEGRFAGGLKRVNPKAEEAQRYAPGGDLHNPAMGRPKNAKVFRRVNGERVQVMGDITPKQWARRVEAVFGRDWGEIEEASRWYEMFDGTMRHFFGDDAEAIMRGFAVSQANASPKDGLGAVLKILYKVRRGEPVGDQEASVVGGAIRDAIKDEEVSRGMAAKLHDFTDSLEGKGTRTWMADLEHAGWPTANDVHAMRDLGYIDPKITVRLRERFKIEVPYDAQGTPSPHQYERMREKYQEITDYLNETHFGGRSDWNPSQAQALGWASIQKLYGVVPEDLRYAVLRNAHQIDMEVTQGVENLGADLNPEEAMQVAREMESLLVELVNDTPDVYLIPEFKYTTGGWEMGQNGQVQFKVVGSARAVEDLTVRLARAFDQWWVQASRVTSSASAGPRSALVITSESFEEEVAKQRFFEALAKLSPKSKNPATGKMEADIQGYMSIDVDGVPSISIRTHKPMATGKQVQPFVDKYDGIIQQAAEEAGVVARSSHQNVALITGGKGGVEDPLKTGSGVAGRATGVDDQLVDRTRAELEAAIERVRSSRGARPGDQGLRSAAADRGRLEGAVGTDPSGRDRAFMVTVRYREGRETVKILAPDEESAKRIALGYHQESDPRIVRVTESLFDAQDLDPLSRRNYHTVGEGNWKAGDLFRAREGWEQAITRLEDGTVPVEFIRGVIDDARLSVHQKAGILQYLDKQTGGELSRVDLSRTFPELERLVGAKRLRGSYRFPGTAMDPFGSIGRHEGALILSETQTRSGTPAHELFHYAHKQGLIPEDTMSALMKFIKERNGEPALAPWTRENDEDLVHVLEVYLLGYGGRGTKPRGMSDEAHKALTSISTWMQSDDALSAGLMYRRQVEQYGKKQTLLGNEFHTPELPPEITDVLDALHISPRKGEYYVPHQRSLPVPVRKDLLRAKKNIANRIAYARSSKNAVGAMWSDPTTRKEFQGYLLKTGAYAADVIRSNEASVAKAVKLHQTNEIRNMMVAAGTPLPSSPTDWAVKVDAHETLGPDFKEFMDKLSAIDEDLSLDVARMEAKVPERRGLKRVLLRRHDLDRIKWDQTDAWQRELFPQALEVDGKVLTGQEMARAVMEKGEEVPNIVWVPDTLIKGSHLLDVPRTLSMKRGDFGPVLGASTRIADAVNDAMRISLLYANPAYYGMNIMGNAALVLMHQGFVAPLNLKNAVMAHWNLGEDLKSVIDNYMGEGLMSVASLRTWHGGKNSISNFANFMVDRIPRRAAWLHEARKLGYKDSDSIKDLIARAEARDVTAREEVDYITRRAKDEMVDFDNMTPLERDVISRIIFVYPWIKGSFRWTLRFPFNHPVQATIYGLAYLRQQELNGTELPERPGYLDLFFPLMDGVRYGNETVWGFNPKQLMPATTPYDLINSVVGFATGDMSTTPLSEYLQPLYSNVLAHITGYDPFSDEKVSRGFLPTAQGVLESLTTEAPGVKNLRAAISGESTEGRLYPRNGTEKWLKVFFGSLAPTPIDPDVAAKYAREEKGAERTAQDLIEKEEKLVGAQMPARVRTAKALKARLDEFYVELRRELDQSNLPDWALTLARARLLNEVMRRDVVGIEQFEQDIQRLTAAQLRAVNAALEQQMDWDADKTWNKAVRIAEEQEANK